MAAWSYTASDYCCSFGAGIPSDLEDGVSTALELSRDGEAMILSGFSTSFRELNFILGPASDHIIFINGEIISLTDLGGNNAHINIRVLR